MPKKLPQIQMVNSCSTCKFAKWGTSDIRWGGKKQGGMCLLGCKGEPPKKPDNYPYFAWLVGCDSRDKFDIRADFQKRELPSRKEFEEHITTFMHSKNSTMRLKEYNSTASNVETPEDIIDYWLAYYDTVAAYKTWWDENYSKARLIHRQTTCDAWEQGPKSRESFALSIAKGTRTLKDKI